MLMLMFWSKFSYKSLTDWLHLFIRDTWSEVKLQRRFAKIHISKLGSFNAVNDHLNSVEMVKQISHPFISKRASKSSDLFYINLKLMKSNNLISKKLVNDNEDNIFFQICHSLNNNHYFWNELINIHKFR